MILSQPRQWTGCPWVINACTHEATKSRGQGWGNSLHKCYEGMGPDIQAQSFLRVWGWGSWYLGDSLLSEMTNRWRGERRQQLCRLEGQTHKDRSIQLLLLPGTLRSDTELELCSLDPGGALCCRFLLRLLQLQHWQAGSWCWAAWEAQILLLYYLKPCVSPTQNHSPNSYNIWQYPEQHRHPTHPQVPPHPHLVPLPAHQPTSYYLDTPDLLLPSGPCTSCTFCLEKPSPRQLQDSLWSTSSLSRPLACVRFPLSCFTFP